MSINNNLYDGSLSKSYILWHVGGPNEFVAAVAEADSFDEIIKVRKRLDWRYQITKDGNPVSFRVGLPLAVALGQDLTLSNR